MYSGSKSLQLKATGLSQVVLHEAQVGLQVGSGDKLFAYVYLDPANPPKEIMLQWHSDTWRHRAYWGDNLIPWGAENTPERVKIGPLPEKGKWVRLEVDAAKLGLKPGMTITGWAFTQQDGVAYWDKAGIVTSLPQGKTNYDSLALWQQRMRAVVGQGSQAGRRRRQDRARQAKRRPEEDGTRLFPRTCLPQNTRCVCSAAPGAGRD